MKRKTFLSLYFVFPFILSGCMEKEITKMDVEMFNASGDSLGTIKVSEQPEGVKFEVMVEGLPEGEHGINIHEKGTCKGPDFKSAGDHLNPDDKKHGLLHPEGAHAGDLPNVISENGKTEAELMAPQLTLKSGKKNSILDPDGAAIVITEKMDDGMTQPAGDSGARIACGEVTEKEANRGDKKEVKPEEEE
ncbi:MULTISPECIES: superoxide dismutase family protein [Bacillaceae]|uniref:superoxide dismutase family protein n=1 Tax=Bacillaceae TaxID=186817 RepID=UPI000BFC7247|nr:MULTISPECIES: superoxide dismutase family protein [Bacillaceae]PGT89291.1 superoxide dismutase [Bacillus sp. AFS040349]UGB30061.1 superoxide dismutase family protein [Metabacillus sp. B2-18]